MPSTPFSGAWRRMVLQSSPATSWLRGAASDLDIVLSSRCRLMRNLAGHRFPSTALIPELHEVADEVSEAAKRECPELRAMKGITAEERNYLVNARLISPEFEWETPARLLMLSDVDSVAMMVNEEDHLRLQVVRGGWDMRSAEEVAFQTMEKLSRSLRFAKKAGVGFLASSLFNAGEGMRRGAMLHLIALANSQKLSKSLEYVVDSGLSVRGLYGESSRAIGAFVQVSSTSSEPAPFFGACDYLIALERAERAATSQDSIKERLDFSVDVVRSSSSLPLSEALRLVGWLRWVAVVSEKFTGLNYRAFDLFLTQLELGQDDPRHESERRRAHALRDLLGV